MSLCALLFELSDNVLLCGDNRIPDGMDFQWSPAFIFLSVLICIIYSAITCDMYTKTRQPDKTFHIAILKTGTIYGIGIFTMHFIGMYALTSPGPMQYDLYITIFSLWIAVTWTSLTLLLLYQKHSLILAAILFGLTICSMHYAGMLSILSNPYFMHHHIGLLVVAVSYAISGSYFALKAFQKYTINHNQRTLLTSATIYGNHDFRHAFDETEKGVITIKISSDNDNVILEYRDNGCGMSEDDNKKMLSPFFTTKRYQGFCGLGMNIVYNQATQKLMGKLACTSSPNEGVYINFSFPRMVDNT